MHVHSKKNSIIGFEGHHIIPGGNDIPEHIVAKMFDDDIMAAKIESGELTVKDAKDFGARKVKTKRKEGPTALETLLAGDEKKVTEYASQVVDLNMLKLWGKKETRDGVKAAIEKQIALIENPQFRGDNSGAGLADADHDSHGEDDGLGFSDADLEESDGHDDEGRPVKKKKSKK